MPGRERARERERERERGREGERERGREGERERGREGERERGRGRERAEGFQDHNDSRVSASVRRAKGFWIFESSLASLF